MIVCKFLVVASMLGVSLFAVGSGRSTANSIGPSAENRPVDDALVSVSCTGPSWCMGTGYMNYSVPWRRDGTGGHGLP